MKRILLVPVLLIAAMMHAQTFTTYTTADGLPSNNVRDVAIAPDGSVWFATQSGVAQFDGISFTVHNTVSHPGLVDNSIVAIAVAANGDVWAGTDFGVSVFDGDSYTTYTTANGLGENQITNIKEAPNGDIWLGTLNGATRISNGVFTAFGSPDIPFGGVLHVAFDTNGDVWLSGGLGGVIRYDGVGFSYLTTAQGLVSNKIRSIAFGSDLRKWVGTAKGISVLDADDQHIGDHTTPFLLPPPDTLNPVSDVAIDLQGNVWAGIYVDYLVTEGGVSVYDGSTWVQYDEQDGLAGPNVRRLAIDAEGDVWVTTSSGVTEISDVNIGISELQRTSGFELFPNPASNEVNIYRNYALVGPGSWELFDARMNRIRADVMTADRVVVDVSGLAQGLYFVKVGSGVSPLVIH